MKRTAHAGKTLGLALAAVALILLIAAGAAQAVSFEKSKNLTAGNLPNFVATGDFNGDTFADIAVVNNRNERVSILLGDGAGNFPKPSGSSAYYSFAVGSSPTGAAVGDFNNDMHPDIAVVNFRGDSVSIHLGDGAGTFTKTDCTASTANCGAGNGPFFIAAGHFNSDSNLDLAVANHTSGNVSILMGNGDGTFDPAVNIAVGSQPVSIAVEDFDNDGNLDLALTNFAGRSVSILLGDGLGAFTLENCNVDRQKCPVSGQPVSIVTGDFNGDGKPDLATANESGKNVSVLLGTENRADLFPNRKNFSLGNRIPVSLTTADFNGDGALDLAAAHFPGDRLSVLSGNGDGTFGHRKAFSVVRGQFAVATDDFDGNGQPDLAVANGKLSVLINDTEFPPGPAPSITVTSPDGGESWTIGADQDITWTSTGINTSTNDNVRIYISRDSGAKWRTLVKSTPNDGTHTWKVKRPAKTTVRIKVCSVNFPAICDASDADFSIVP
jgi:hypothetical protein